MLKKSEKSHAVLDEGSRQKKAQKIITVLENETNLKKASVLDIGTGAGYIACSLSSICDKVCSVDLHDERVEKEGYEFTKVADEKLPFRNSSFDIVVTNHVIEHVPDHQTHMGEIHRVLKEGGTVYLATPNKYWLTDPHHKLPFISWLPRKWANSYLKKVKGKEWDIYPLSYGRIINLSKNKFSPKYMTIDIMKQPERYNLHSSSKIIRFVNLLPRPALLLFKRNTPTHIFVLYKK